MSLEALNWAFALQLPKPGTKLVLLTLANYANEEGEAFPSQKALSEKSCLSERAVRDNLTLLERWKVIVRVPRVRANGSYTTDLFKLNVGCSPVIESASNDENCQRQNLPSAEIAAGEAVDNHVDNSQTQRQISPNPAADSAGPESFTNYNLYKPTEEEIQTRARLNALGVSNDSAKQWELIRKGKDLGLSLEDVEVVFAEANAAGISMQGAVDCCCEQVWAWFRAKWYADLRAKSQDGEGSTKNQSAGGGWRNSPSGVNKRGEELGLGPRVGESQDAYRKRVIGADKDARFAQLEPYRGAKRSAGGSG